MARSNRNPVPRLLSAYSRVLLRIEGDDCVRKQQAAATFRLISVLIWLDARSKYVDVLNPSSGSGGARKLASAPGPPLPIPAQSFTGSIFVPQSDVTGERMTFA